MKIVYQIGEIKDLLMQVRSQNKAVGFVPTMGALHEGHLSLLERSQEKCDISIVSIFVNPTQFNDPNDFLKYPKLLEQDIELLENKKCDVLFCPSVEEMYPNGLEERLNFPLGLLEEVLEGEKRKGHYQGVVMILNAFFKAISNDRHRGLGSITRDMDPDQGLPSIISKTFNTLPNTVAMIKSYPAVGGESLWDAIEGEWFADDLKNSVINSIKTQLKNWCQTPKNKKNNLCVVKSRYGL
jgi:cytidyltransferase-like protein